MMHKQHTRSPANVFQRLKTAAMREPRRGPTWYTASWTWNEPLHVMQHSLLRLLSTIHSERLEPAPWIIALAMEHRGRFRRQLFRLAHRLNQGVALIDAIEQTPDVLSDHAVLGLRLGSQSGTLRETYDQLLESERPTAHDAGQSWEQEQYYWSAVFVAFLMMIFFIGLFIAPTLGKMALDFEEDVGLPGIRTPSFRWFLQFVRFTGENIGFLTLIALSILWLLWSSISRRFFRCHIAIWFRGSNTRQTLELLPLLAVSLHAGRPIAACLSTLAKYHYDKRMRGKLLFARNEVEQGTDPWHSLSEAGILTSNQATAIQQLPSNHARAWTIERIASSQFVRFNRRSFNWLTLAQIPILIGFGTVVLWVGYAHLSVLAKLVLLLSEPT